MRLALLFYDIFIHLSLPLPLLRPFEDADPKNIQKHLLQRAAIISELELSFRERLNPTPASPTFQLAFTTHSAHFFESASVVSTLKNLNGQKKLRASDGHIVLPEHSPTAAAACFM